MNPVRRILVATDFSPCADAAADLAAQLARPLEAMIELVTVVDVSWVTDASGEPAWHEHRIEEIRRHALHRLQAVAEQHLAGVEEIHLHVFDGGLDPPDPSAEIVRVADLLGCDLIVLGTHGKTGLEHLVIGSVAEKVVRRCRIPVLTVHAPG